MIPSRTAWAGGAGFQDARDAIFGLLRQWLPAVIDLRIHHEDFATFGDNLQAIANVTYTASFDILIRRIDAWRRVLALLHNNMMRSINGNVPALPCLPPRCCACTRPPTLWARLLLLLAGDVERNPGPARAPNSDAAGSSDRPAGPTGSQQGPTAPPPHLDGEAWREMVRSTARAHHEAQLDAMARAEVSGRAAVKRAQRSELRRALHSGSAKPAVGRTFEADPGSFVPPRRPHQRGGQRQNRKREQRERRTGREQGGPKERGARTGEGADDAVVACQAGARPASGPTGSSSLADAPPPRHAPAARSPVLAARRARGPPTSVARRTQEKSRRLEGCAI